MKYILSILLLTFPMLARESAAGLMDVASYTGPPFTDQLRADQRAARASQYLANMSSEQGTTNNYLYDIHAVLERMDERLSGIENELEPINYRGYLSDIEDELKSLKYSMPDGWHKRERESIKQTLETTNIILIVFLLFFMVRSLMPQEWIKEIKENMLLKPLENRTALGAKPSENLPPET